VLELTLRVPTRDLENVLDSLLPALPGGVHIRERDGGVELTLPATPDTPGENELRRLAGASLIDLTSAEASEDWRERRLSRYEPFVVAERFLVRPDWAPPSDDPGLTEIVLGQSAAFGTGLHPTTHACLAVLAQTPPDGSLADYGCGSGVLSIAAAELGFSPVIAVDVDPLSVEATRANAARNGVEIDVRRVDVTSEPPPHAETIVANVPPDIQVALSGVLAYKPELVLASGFKRDESEQVASAWGAHGLRVVDELSAHEWMVLVLG
jgi:ribosomal protein L11 methyltransferase